eukprot:4159554-Pyramimonas_sp.AAC.1
MLWRLRGGAASVSRLLGGDAILEYPLASEAHPHSFPTRFDEYFFRVCMIRAVEVGLAESTAVYNAWAVTVLSYVLQLHRPTRRLLQLE